MAPVRMKKYPSAHTDLLQISMQLSTVPGTRPSVPQRGPVQATWWTKMVVRITRTTGKEED